MKKTRKVKSASRKSTARLNPIPIEEIAARKPIPPKVEKPPHAPAKTFYVTDPEGASPSPTVNVEKVEGTDHPTLWKVNLNLLEAVEVHILGRSTGAVEIPRSPVGKSKPGAKSKGLSGYRPPHLGVSFRPQVVRPSARTNYEFRGKTYRPLYVFGGDDRHLLTDTGWPWLLTGKITTSDGKSGSGAFVGNRLVLTAWHVRPAQSIDAGNWWMKFTPHYFDGTEPFGSSFVSDLRVPGGSFEVPHDFMICRLYEPLGEQLGYFGTEEYTEDWNDDGVWACVGYPDDLSSGERPFVQLDCNFEDSESSGGGQVLETECDLGHGDSGGPFWAWFPDNDPRIVAVVSSEADFSTEIWPIVIHDHDNAAAGGADMVHLVDWARANWP